MSKDDISRLDEKTSMQMAKLELNWTLAEITKGSDITFITALWNLGEVVQQEMIEIYQEFTGNKASSVDEILNYIRDTGGDSKDTHVGTGAVLFTNQISSWVLNATTGST